MTSQTTTQDQPIILIPVFCTVPIPAQVLDRLITCSLAYPTEQNTRFRLRIITTTDSKELSAITTGSEPPMQDFESPFLDQDTYHLWITFLKNLKHLDQFTNGYFIWLDERALDDLNYERCMAVTMYWDGDQIMYEEWVRDFYMVRDMADYVETTFKKEEEEMEREKEEERKKRKAEVDEQLRSSR